MKNTRFILRGVLVALAAALPGVANACASCGCTLTSDWESLGISTRPGMKVDLRYDYLNQNQLRSGSGTISPMAAAAVVNPGGNAQEVERFTRNQYFTLGLDYNFSPNWGINLVVPYLARTHDTLGTASDGVAAGAGGGQYKSSLSAPGDVKLLGRYQGLNAAHDLGLILGVKLPTGSHQRSGESTDSTAPGSVPIDRGLQPGSGTTDLILGAFHVEAINQDWDGFQQVLVQAALDASDDYKPGVGVNLSLGLRYQGFEGFAPQLQVNARHAQRDSGAQADTVSTGGTLVYLSPGVVVPLGDRASVYGFLQLPVYQYVNGVQLAPRITLSLGLRYSF